MDPLVNIIVTTRDMDKQVQPARKTSQCVSNTTWTGQ